MVTKAPLCLQISRGGAVAKKFYFTIRFPANWDSGKPADTQPLLQSALSFCVRRHLAAQPVEGNARERSHGGRSNMVHGPNPSSRYYEAVLGRQPFL